MGAKAARTDSREADGGIWKANRERNQALIVSVNWLTSVKLPPCPETKFVILARSPTRSGQSSFISSAIGEAMTIREKTQIPATESGKGAGSRLSAIDPGAGSR